MKLFCEEVGNVRNLNLKKGNALQFDLMSFDDIYSRLQIGFKNNYHPTILVDLEVWLILNVVDWLEAMSFLKHENNYFC